MNRDAAAVLLLRGAGADCEVFLVERSPKLRFFGGYLALPGGVRSAVDEEFAGGDADAALRWCAAREMFEETGVALVDLGDAAREPVRRALLADDDRGWRAAIGRDAALALVDVCRIRTPPFAPVRYDTLFALAELPQHEVPEVWPGELVGGRFWRPQEALAAWRRGEVLIVPPVLLLLDLLRGGDRTAFLRDARALADSYHAGALHRVQFSPGVVMASVRTPTLPPATTTNCLIVGERDLVVVDPGSPYPEEQERLARLLAEMQAEGRNLRAVVLTHHHVDHASGAVALCQRFGLRVCAHPRTLAALPDLPAAAPLGDGDGIPLGTAPDGTPGWQLQAVFTPGHAQGHLCLRESRYGALIAGDMLSTVSTIVIDPPQGHMRTYLQSLERLRALPITTLYPAHGPAVRDGRALVEHYLRHRAARQGKLERALAQRPATEEELLGVVYDDVDPSLHPIAARSLLAGLLMAEEEGRAVRQGDRWCAAPPRARP